MLDILIAAVRVTVMPSRAYKLTYALRSCTVATPSLGRHMGHCCSHCCNRCVEAKTGQGPSTASRHRSALLA